ncbi:MAG: DinB family protein [Ignavibacteria bacterium]|nr:DinB family protein [Ignavibacteria bacterium]
MQYRTIDEFIKDWGFESQATIKIISSLTDASLKKKAYKEGRTLGYLAWHLATSISEMIRKTGLEIYFLDPESDNPDKVKEIMDAYEKVSNELTEKIQSDWTDKSLTEEVEMYGEKWKKGEALESLVKHQIHHRGQMTVYMRIAGVFVPGIYGPSKEEWKDYGMEPQR